MRKVYYCPDCGGEMLYTGDLAEEEYNRYSECDLLDWECPKCELEGELKWDDVNKESYIKLAKEYTREEIFEDPIGNQPDCCVGCNPAYPSCVIGCKIFDK